MWRTKINLQPLSLKIPQRAAFLRVLHQISCLTSKAQWLQVKKQEGGLHSCELAADFSGSQCTSLTRWIDREDHLRCGAREPFLFPLTNQLAWRQQNTAWGPALSLHLLVCLERDSSLEVPFIPSPEYWGMRACWAVNIVFSVLVRFSNARKPTYDFSTKKHRNLFLFQKKKKYFFKIPVQVKRGWWLRWEITSDFPRAGELEYPPVALFRILTGSTGSLSVCARKTCFWRNVIHTLLI